MAASQSCQQTMGQQTHQWKERRFYPTYVYQKWSFMSIYVFLIHELLYIYIYIILNIVTYLNLISNLIWYLQHFETTYKVTRQLQVSESDPPSAGFCSLLHWAPSLLTLLASLEQNSQNGVIMVHRVWIKIGYRVSNIMSTPDLMMDFIAGWPPPQ